MFTRAVVCDAPRCTVMRPVVAVDGDPGDGAFDGFITIHINRPPDYNWTFGGERPTSSLVGSFDCCSISCAREVLRLASDHVPTETSQRPVSDGEPATDDTHLAP